MSGGPLPSWKHLSYHILTIKNMYIDRVHQWRSEETFETRDHYTINSGHKITSFNGTRADNMDKASRDNRDSAWFTRDAMWQLTQHMKSWVIGNKRRADRNLKELDASIWNSGYELSWAKFWRSRMRCFQCWHPRPDSSKWWYGWVWIETFRIQFRHAMEWDIMLQFCLMVQITGEKATNFITHY